MYFDISYLLANDENLALQFQFAGEISVLIITTKTVLEF